MNKITPENITKLLPNQVFVYGSNTRGIHGAGAAKYAHKHFGAKYGVGRGLEGQSYALPTKDFNIEALHLYEIEAEIKTYLDFTATRPDLEFLTTAVATGLAGYTYEEVGKLFAKFDIPSNVSLPKEFWEEINKKARQRPRK